MAVVDNMSLYKGLSRYKDNDNFSDLIIKCATASWQVHRVILCAQSSFFQRACESKFKEGISQTVTLEEVEPELVNRMISFFYSGDYVDEVDPLASDAQTLLVNARLYAMGDQFGVPGLKARAISKTASELDRTGRQWREDIFPAASVVWGTTPSSDTGLRNEYIKLFIYLRRIILKDKEKWEELDAVPKLARDILISEWTGYEG